MDYATLLTREGQNGPWAPSYFVEVPQYRMWDAWYANLRAQFEPIATSIAARQKLRTWLQLGFVQDCTSRFLALCEQVGYMHESERIDRYIGGLKHDVAQEIQLRSVNDFREILAMAEVGVLRKNSNWGHRSHGTNEGATIRAIAANVAAALFKGRCFACNRPGHRNSECPENAKGKGEAEQQKQTKQQGNAGNGGASHSLINTATSRNLRLPLDRCLPEIDARLSSSVRINAITMKHAVAAGADMYAVDIREAEAADKGGDLQKLLADVLDDLAALLKQYSGIFPDDLPTGLPLQRPHDHRIELEPGAQFRLTQPELDELRKQLDYLLEKEFIRQSSSLFAAPILFTPKRDGGFRMCIVSEYHILQSSTSLPFIPVLSHIDYRALNRVTIKSRYPIPRADELIDQVRTTRVFSKFDLRGGYHQIRVNPPDCPKTAFRTRYGSFEYTVMPFGLTNASATFQMTMNEAFRQLLDKCVIVYLGDILTYSPDRAQNLQDIEAVFKILSENRVRICSICLACTRFVRDPAVQQIDLEVYRSF
ncbi:unnamed protein product [Closterium sp. NIES-53]